MRVFVMLGALALSGCASAAARFGTATMEADPAEIGVEGIALQNQLALAYTRTRPTVKVGKTVYADPDLCRYTLPSFQERGKYSYSRHSPPGQESAEKKFECVYFIQNPQALQVRNYVRAGMALSDLYCDTYFRRISRRWNERLFARNTTNDVGAAISAVLGLVKAGSGLTGGVGAGFGLADSAFRNYDNVFVVSPDLPAMQKLVREHQKELRESFEALPDTDLTNFYMGESKIIEYAQLCSYTGMKGLLNQAVDQTINDLRGGDGIRSAVVKAATARDTQRRAIAEKRAENREAEAAALKREKEAQRQIDEAAQGKTGDTEQPGQSGQAGPGQAGQSGQAGQPSGEDGTSGQDQTGGAQQDEPAEDTSDDGSPTPP